MILPMTLASSLLGGSPAEPPPAEPPVQAPVVDPIAVPEQVRDAAESGAGPLPQPEQVRDSATLEPSPPAPDAAAQPPDPAAQPPDPQARPSEGVYAVGSSGIAPLPPPPPPVPVETIARGRWSGTGWLAVRLLVTGPLAGDTPGRPTVVALGGGVEGGWRIRQWIGFGTAFSRQPHEVFSQPLLDGTSTIKYRGHMSAWDIGLLRLYAPVRGRVDPYIDVGGGLSFFEPARARASSLGGTVRASVGFEAWITRHLTLGLSGLYRANFNEKSIGHAWQAALDFGLHW